MPQYKFYENLDDKYTESFLDATPSSDINMRSLINNANSVTISPLKSIKFNSKYELYDWQIDAINTLIGKDAILIAPTGSGKTEVLKAWADLDNPNQKVIITAPIKALSNERYAELKEAGYDVGINTGDFKDNTEARIICCTQEIYTVKYSRENNINVVIDEFHYIANNQDRSRAYLDGILNTSKDSRILLLSATIGNPEEVAKHLSRISEREFKLYETNERMTKLNIPNKPKTLNYNDIKNALIFSFAAKNCKTIAKNIAVARKHNPNFQKHILTGAKFAKVEELANILNAKEFLVSNKDTIKYGVCCYFGAMQPNEKLFVETLYRNKYIDTLTGTDSLALGVNLPAETVIFSQLAKYYDGPITSAEFFQMAGRAGRKGFFDTGYVAILSDSEEYESYGFNTSMIYEHLVKAPITNMVINPEPNFKNILSATNFSAILNELKDAKTKSQASIAIRKAFKTPAVKSAIRDECFLVKKYSMQAINFKNLENDIYYKIDEVVEAFASYYKMLLVNQSDYIEFFQTETKSDKSFNELAAEDTVLALQTLSETYFSEFDAIDNSNVITAYGFHHPANVDVLEIAQSIDNIQDLLQFKRFINSLPIHIKSQIPNRHEIDFVITNVDPTVLNYVTLREEANKVLSTSAKKRKDIER